MMFISEQITIPLSPLIVWPLLCDLDSLFALIPGATLTARGASAAYGALRIQLGPTIALFRGQITFTYDQSKRRIRIAAQAADARSKSSLSGDWIVRLSGSETTALSIEGNITVAGVLAPVVTGEHSRTGRVLIEQFGQRIVARATAEDASAQGAPAPDAASLTMVGFDDAPPVRPSLRPVPASRALVPVHPPGLARAAIRRWHELFGWLGQFLPRGGAPLPH